MGYKKIGPFLERVSILGEFFFRTGCQFGDPGGTYPPQKYPSAPPGEIMSFIPPSRGYRTEATYTRCSQDAQQEKVRNSWAVVNYQGDLVTYQLAHMPDVGPCSFYLCRLLPYASVSSYWWILSSAFHRPQFLLYLLLNWSKFPYFYRFLPFL